MGEAVLCIGSQHIHNTAANHLLTPMVWFGMMQRKRIELDQRFETIVGTPFLLSFKAQDFTDVISQGLYALGMAQNSFIAGLIQPVQTEPEIRAGHILGKADENVGGGVHGGIMALLQVGNYLFDIAAGAVNFTAQTQRHIRHGSENSAAQRLILCQNTRGNTF